MILPKPASVHARAPAVRPSWPTGGHPACTCVCSALSPGSHGNGHGRKPRACPHLAGGPQPPATGRAVFGSPTRPRERLGRQPSAAAGTGAQPPLSLGDSASSTPHPIIHPSACNRPPTSPCSGSAPSSPPFRIGVALAGSVGHGSHDAAAAPRIEGGFRS